MGNPAAIRNSFSAAQLHITVSQCTCGKIVGETTLNSISGGN